ncbi:hypothetical protein [Clostridium estertheticum]|uniref:hypothetical protein n=1 Tax=Clostridium estertheticum TaxID=238834 RepID=UPI001CF2C361|nr:hypothetical protein [Clostridium estertheticum]MCB2353559.1 hypothetical protein [Clostridium estertheticum]WAG41894.1 hypothetical protein LL065_04070 [Clostridium estertheticum]
MKICVLIRVFDRIEDLECNIEIIKKTWNNFDYDIIIVSNGKSKGYKIDMKKLDGVFKVVELNENVGHMKGSSQLLIEGMKSIELEKYEKIIILEADTWIYGDNIIKKYIKIMKNEDAVWASAKWYQRYYSLATDFAIIDTKFLMKNKEIFNFEELPEYYVAQYISTVGEKYVWIKEGMPVMVPSYIKKYPFAPKGRFFIFPKMLMVTHHIEYLKLGIMEKKTIFNAITGSPFFDTELSKSKKIMMIKWYFFVKVVFNILPQKTWVRSIKYFYSEKDFLKKNEK